MKTNVIHPLWKPPLASLATTVGATDEPSNQTSESLQASAQTPGTIWKTVATQTITANGISFAYPGDGTE